jgi:hypothetical protein
MLFPPLVPSPPHASVIAINAMAGIKCSPQNGRGDLRSAVSAGSETRAERSEVGLESRAERGAAGVDTRGERSAGAGSERRSADAAVFQFHLRHLFLLVSLLCVYFALVRATGEFVATLVIGTLILRATVILLRIESVFYGGIVGTCAAGVLLVGAAMAFSPSSPLAVFGCLVYPVVGYTIGVLCASHRQLSQLTLG